MRLTCPNCDARYEVPDNVVPPEGRDVQCSNCGQTWFQHPADHAPQAEDDLAQTAISPDDEETGPPRDTIEHVSQTPEPTQPRADNKGLDDLDDLPEGATPARPARKELDPAIADILQEEAQTEQAARAERTSDPLESQPDLGLDGADDAAAAERTAQARQRMARLRGEPEPMSEADVNAAAVSSRRDLLPDIDEINSTLRTENDRTTASPHPEIEAPSTQKRKRGFRFGFMLMLVLFAILALVYVYAPQIAQAVPQVEPYLSAYVAWVDQMRAWLDGQVQSLLRWLDTMASQSGA